MLGVSRAEVKIGSLIGAAPCSSKNFPSTHMGSRRIFRLAQLCTSCMDFAPASQNQRRLNDEAKNKARREGLVNQKHLGHVPLCLSGGL